MVWHWLMLIVAAQAGCARAPRASVARASFFNEWYLLFITISPSAVSMSFFSGSLHRAVCRMVDPAVVRFGGEYGAALPRCRLAVVSELLMASSFVLCLLRRREKSFHTGERGGYEGIRERGGAKDKGGETK